MIENFIVKTGNNNIRKVTLKSKYIILLTLVGDQKFCGNKSVEYNDEFRMNA